MKKSLKLMSYLSLLLLSLSVIFNSSLSFVNAQEQVLNISTSSEPPSIDPALATDTTSGAILRNVFEGLTRPDSEPGVAESWEVSEDGLVYVFNLRQDAKWTNGDPVTANDFVYGWTRVLTPDTGSQYAANLYVIKGAEAFNTGEGEESELGFVAKDDYTLEVTLANPTPYFLELLSHYTYMPVNQAAVEADANWALEAGEGYVTNGPFVLESWNHHSDYVLAKNELYWDAANVSLETVNVQIIESEATANSEWQAGQLDYLGAPYGTVSLDAIDMYRADGSLNTAPYNGVYWFKVNTTDEFLSNVNLRKALAYSMDRQTLIDNILKGEQIAALGVIPPTIEGFEEDRGYFADADVEKGKEYLATALEELGLADPSELTLEVSFNTSEAHSTIVQYLQEGWAQNLGINVTVRNSEWQVYLDEISGLQYQVGRLGWIGDYNDATTFLDMYRTKDTGNNDTGWENEEFKNLLDQAAAEQDSDARKELLLQAEALFMEEMPVLPLYFYTNNYVVKDNVENMKPDALGNIDLKKVSIAAE